MRGRSAEGVRAPTGLIAALSSLLCRLFIRSLPVSCCTCLEGAARGRAACSTTCLFGPARTGHLRRRAPARSPSRASFAPASRCSIFLLLQLHALSTCWSLAFVLCSFAVSPRGAPLRVGHPWPPSKNGRAPARASTRDGGSSDRGSSRSWVPVPQPPLRPSLMKGLQACAAASGKGEPASPRQPPPTLAGPEASTRTLSRTSEQRCPRHLCRPDPCMRQRFAVPVDQGPRRLGQRRALDRSSPRRTLSPFFGVLASVSSAHAVKVHVRSSGCKRRGAAGPSPVARPKQPSLEAGQRVEGGAACLLSHRRGQSRFSGALQSTTSARTTLLHAAAVLLASFILTRSSQPTSTRSSPCSPRPSSPSSPPSLPSSPSPLPSRVPRVRPLSRSGGRSTTD